VLRLLYEALNSGEQGEELSKLHSQGAQLLQRFERSGHVAILERATAMLSKAVAFAPLSSLDGPRQLHNLGKLSIRFQRFGKVNPLDSAELPGFLGNLG
jgi:hypothetical protein